jgi:hypothetical protein
MKWLGVNQNSGHYGRTFLRFVLLLVDNLAPGVFRIG